MWRNQIQIFLTIDDNVGDHSKIMYEILYDYNGTILWSNYDQPGTGCFLFGVFIDRLPNESRYF